MGERSDIGVNVHSREVSGHNSVHKTPVQAQYNEQWLINCRYGGYPDNKHRFGKQVMSPGFGISH